MLERNTEFAKLRERAGLSVEEAAQLLHVSDRSVRRYELVGPRGSDAPALAMDFMRRMANAQVPKIAPAATSFRFIDLFAGIGGLRRPFEEIGGKCVFTAEWDRYSRQTYTANFHDNEALRLAA